MAQIKSIQDIAAKWASVTPLRGADYAAGIANPRRPWAASTMNAESAYNAGVTAAIQRSAFSKGVSRAGDEKWFRKASTIGVNNWGPGVAAAEGDYSAGFAPYREAIAGVVLPPRYARGDPRNLARVKAIADVMIATRLRLEGGAGARALGVGGR